nr:MAG TPA: hypothetical protein [Caudoviricetes sp.]
MSLPGGYTELEYIQSSGTQYLDSGVTFEKTDTVEFEILWTVTPPSSGTYVGGNYYMQVGMGTSGYGIYAASNTKAYGTKDRMRVTFASVQETLLVNDAQVFTHDWSGQNLSNVKLGILKLGMEGNAWYSSAPVSAKVYSCTIKKGGALVRNFIPCKNAAGVIGLWDDVNSVFYQNAGSGVFTAGPEVRGTHKTLIGGTAYEVKAGKCLINGTAYAIQKGRTLINGTGYDIALASLYDPVFANNEWADIIAACHAGAVPDTWAVGDYKDMTIDGLSYRVDIIGKNHDAYLDGTAAPLTFQLHDCYETRYSMQVPASNQRYWENCQMRKTHLPAILNLLPDEIQTGIRAVNKTTYGMRATDKLFLLSESEVFGSNQYSADGEGAQYAYYAAGNSRIKKVNGSAYDWWLRSPCIEDVDSYCIVSSGGYRSYKASNYNVGVSFAFCF